MGEPPGLGHGGDTQGSPWHWDVELFCRRDGVNLAG